MHKAGIMTQKYKAVYFPEHPGNTSQKKSLTLAFGKKSDELYESVKGLSSTELRLLLKEDYQALVANAEADDLPFNTYCLRQLKQSINLIRERAVQLELPSIDEKTVLFDPVTVTFKAGRKEPFARWYPYLEGYSTQFVETILKRYAPNAQTILDPFSGTGTTAFTASQLDRTAYFCEINPVLQFLSLTKIQVRRLNTSQRSALAKRLVQAKGELRKLEQFPQCNRLHQAYQQTFDDSLFFDAPVYNQVLRARSWIDEVTRTNPMLANLITVATLSTLVPASRMQRAGDLRYKTTSELERQTVPFVEGIDQNINQIIHDIRDGIGRLRIEPLLVCENARSLGSIPPLDIDAVITSPPYVNGTNYLRNTKIELWFLRCLKEKRDLRTFRAASLTAGINDVTVAKTPVLFHPEVQKIVSELDEHAYDSRIPRMIGCYFGEITDIFRAIRSHLTPDATIAIDIGDSCYAGVHVPVDALLSSCLRDLGFVQEDSVTLRKRKSRGGMLLKQSLLVFRYGSNRKKSKLKKQIPLWHDDWNDFKQYLPHQQTPFTKRNWGHAWHSLCSYPGKLKPAIARHLVDTFVPMNGRVLDTFAGVGTIPFEAALTSKHAYGFEISPAAYAIASAKLQCPSEQGCRTVIEKVEDFIACHSVTEAELTEVNNLGFNGKIAEYYEPQTLKEVILARRFFQAYPSQTPEGQFVLASLLHILHGNRPYALSRRSHPLTPYKPTGAYEYRPLIGRLLAKVQRGLDEDLPADFRPGEIFFQDATRWWPREIDQLDAVITSPPFFDSTRFYLANWLRLWFSGWSATDFEASPSVFVDEQQKSSFDVYIPILRQAKERLKSNGVFVLHLGKSVKCDMAAHLRQLGKQWFRSADLYDESVVHCESHGMRDKGTVTSHQYLVLY
jgi:DNA modification methylase